MDSERQKAPDALWIVQSFVNTLDLETGEDELATAAGATAWAAGHGLEVGAVGAAGRRRAVELREALRVLLRAHGVTAQTDPQALATVNRIAAAAPVTLGLDPSGGARATPAGGGVETALAAVLAAVHDAIRDGTWERLKVCADGDCGWVFYDRSRNRSGRWCSMAECGCRDKVRAFRARQAAARSDPVGDPAA